MSDENASPMSHNFSSKTIRDEMLSRMRIDGREDVVQEYVFGGRVDRSSQADSRLCEKRRVDVSGCEMAERGETYFVHH